MNKYLLMIAALSAPLIANASPIPQANDVVTYINSTHIPREMQVKAEYLIYSLARIYKEDWNNNAKTFENISDDISISLSCYLYEAEKHNQDTKLLLIDEIQTLMTSTRYSKSLYDAFMKKDMQRQHEVKEKSICSALI
ncbi:hypothetical protein OTK49_01880 [Vibrio coralliirubri]|uniref:hypothetical protein n=1 Tax=Vibrio coralliirubri TaxID=1516159 RepID=UPI002284E6DD|nr:hypothetical protein [Vibrio coralliirubri]MCY9861263.1 hypothetical protein [Vibrio coralliirubri]